MHLSIKHREIIAAELLMIANQKSKTRFVQKYTEQNRVMIEINIICIELGIYV